MPKIGQCIEATNLILEPLSEETLENVARIFANGSINRWFPTLCCRTIGSIKTVLREEYYDNLSDADYSAVIFDKQSHKIIGFCALLQKGMDGHSYKIDIAINPSFQKRGIASEALSALILHQCKTFLGTAHSVENITAIVVSNNVASKKLFARLNQHSKLAVTINVVDFGYAPNLKFTLFATAAAMASVYFASAYLSQSM